MEKYGVLIINIPVNLKYKVRAYERCIKKMQTFGQLNLFQHAWKRNFSQNIGSLEIMR